MLRSVACVRLRTGPAGVAGVLHLKVQSGRTGGRASRACVRSTARHAHAIHACKHARIHQGQLQVLRGGWVQSKHACVHMRACMLARVCRCVHACMRALACTCSCAPVRRPIRRRGCACVGAAHRRTRTCLRARMRACTVRGVARTHLVPQPLEHLLPLLDLLQRPVYLRPQLALGCHAAAPPASPPRLKPPLLLCATVYYSARVGGWRAAIPISFTLPPRH